MLIIDNNNISLSRGNTAFIDVSIEKDGEPYTLQAGEKLLFSIKRKNDFNNVILEKESITPSFSFSKNDTVNMGLGSYVYSITYLGLDNIIDTFITGDFKLISEVANYD